MKIIELQAENFKKLKAVRIKADGTSVYITGKNGAGKSTVLDAIEYALSGAKSFSHVKKPINQEARDRVLAKEDTCRIVIDLDDYVVTRNWTNDETSYLKITSKDGARIGNPQELFNRFISTLAFDPLEFCRVGSEKQARILMDAMKITSKVEVAEAEFRVAYSERREIGRQLKAMESVVGEAVEDEQPPAIPDMNALMEQLQEAQKHNSQVDRLHQMADDLASDCRDRETYILNLQKKLEQAKVDLKDSQDKHKRVQKAIKDHRPKDVQVIRDQIDQASELKVRVQRYNDQVRDRKRLDDLKEKYNTANESVAKAQATISQLFDSASLPITGLEYSTDEGVLFNGFPVAQASKAEQIKLGFAILQAQDPKVRSFLVRDGSLLDGENRQLLEDLCKEHDFQAWIEVADKQDFGILIEDGEIK